MDKEWKNNSVNKLIGENNHCDPIDIIRHKAQDIVLKGYNFGWAGPPFDPIQLAKYLGIEISPNEEIFDSRIIPLSNNKFRIEYNPFQKQARINFSIAHEIGHTLFSDCDLFIRNRETELDDTNWELEFLCNVAASEILLPISEFTHRANNIDLNLNSLLEIANEYQASIESVFLRFVEVVEKPATIAICIFNEDLNELRIQYSKSSNQAVLNLTRGFQIPNDSKVNDCLNPGWTSYEKHNWGITDTIYNIYAIGLPPIKRQRINRVGVLFVPEFYSNEVEQKIYTVFGDATQPRGGGPKIITQVINTSGALGFGFGRSMSAKWPQSKKVVKNWKENKSEFQLGKYKLTQLTNDIYVFQIIAQKGIKPSQGQIPLKYEALHSGLKYLSQVALELKASVHMPQIGVGQAKGDWSLIEGLIHSELVKKGIKTTVYILPGSQAKKRPNHNLTLFQD